MGVDRKALGKCRELVQQHWRGIDCQDSPARASQGHGVHSETSAKIDGELTGPKYGSQIGLP